MLTSKRNLVIAFFAVLSFAFFLNAINLNAIRKQTDKSNEFLNKELVFNYTILSVDNSWYLPQIHNYLAGKGFTCDTSDAKLLKCAARRYIQCFMAYIICSLENKAVLNISALRKHFYLHLPPLPFCFPYFILHKISG